MPELFDNAVDAWTHLAAHGGLEVDGRDAAFVEQLLVRLTTPIYPELVEEAPVLDVYQVLRKVSVEQLVNAMFGLGRPFIRMMRDLLDHFKRAHVTEGPGQWKLLLTSEKDTLEADLEDFRKWIETSGSQSTPFMIPVLEPGQLWDVSWAFSAEREYRQTIGARPSAGDTDSGGWLSTYESTFWLPLPPVVHRMRQRTDQLREVAAIVSEVASAMQSIVPNYEALYSHATEVRSSAPEDIRPYVFIEHDRWIKSMVRNFAVFEDAEKQERERILSKLGSILDGVQLRAAQFICTLEGLTAFLDLPIWKKRYELYSAWLLTQFLAAMEGHTIKYHDEGGKLTFGFHATKFATVNSTYPPINIYGERRVTATQLRGHGRKAGIQPDYTAWTEGTDRCVLAIECKHYKRASYRNFRDALHDYASNLPDARVFLGNYGSIPVILKLDTRNGGESGRQFVWGNLNPDWPEEVASFRSAIRKIFGDPVQPGNIERSRGLSRVLGIDVSPSMLDALNDGEVEAVIAEIVSKLAITHFAAVDDHLLAFEPVDMQRIHCFTTQSTSSGTDLRDSATSLSKTASALFFLTDQEGLLSLGDLAVEKCDYDSRFPQLRVRGVSLVRITL